MAETVCIHPPQNLSPTHTGTGTGKTWHALEPAFHPGVIHWCGRDGRVFSTLALRENKNICDDREDIENTHTHETCADPSGPSGENRLAASLPETPPNRDHSSRMPRGRHPAGRTEPHLRDGGRHAAPTPVVPTRSDNRILSFSRINGPSPELRADHGHRAATIKLDRMLVTCRVPQQLWLPLALALHLPHGALREVALVAAIASVGRRVQVNGHTISCTHSPPPYCGGLPGRPSV